MQSKQRGGQEREAGWLQGTTLIVQQVLPTMGSLLLVPGVPLILREYGDMPGAAYWIPSLLTVPALCMAFLSAFAGVIGDRIGRRGPLLAALALYGAAGMAPLFLSSFGAIFASRVLLGVCEAVIATLSMTMLADYFSGPRRDRWLALVTTLGGGSAVVFFMVSGALGALYGWRAPTAVYGLALLMVPAMLAFTWEPKRHHLEPVDNGASPFPWVHVLSVAGVTIFGSTMFFVIAIQQAFGLIALGLNDPARIGVLTAISGMGGPIGSLIFRRMVTIRTSRMLCLELFLIGGALFAMSRSTTDIQFTAAAAIGMVGAGMVMPTLVTWMVRGLPFAVRSRGVGIFQSVFSLGQFASGLILPFLARNVVDGTLPAFGLIGLCGLVAAAIAFARGSMVKPIRLQAI